MNITITVGASGHVGTRITESADVCAVRRNDAEMFKPSVCNGMWCACKKTGDCQRARREVDLHFDVFEGFELCGLCMLVLRVRNLCMYCELQESWVEAIM